MHYARCLGGSYPLWVQSAVAYHAHPQPELIDSENARRRDICTSEPCRTFDPNNEQHRGDVKMCVSWSTLTQIVIT